MTLNEIIHSNTIKDEVELDVVRGSLYIGFVFGIITHLGLTCILGVNHNF